MRKQQQQNMKRRKENRARTRKEKMIYLKRAKKAMQRKTQIINIYREKM